MSGAHHVRHEVGDHALQVQVLGEDVDALGQLAQPHLGDVARDGRLRAVEALLLEPVDERALRAHALRAHDPADRLLSLSAASSSLSPLSPALRAQPSTSDSSAFCACSRFSASSKTTEHGRVDDVVGDLLAAVRGQAVHEDRATSPPAP